MIVDNRLKYPAEAIAKYLKENKRIDNFEYGWIKENKNDTLMKNFTYISNVFDWDGFNWEEYFEDTKQGNRNLKKYLSKLWKDIANSKEIKADLSKIWKQNWNKVNQMEALANWIIKDWGNISNSIGRIQKHINLVDNVNVIKGNMPFAGIASYSKLLAIKNPEKFAIYDSRVAVAISAIQLINKPSIPIKFGYPKGRGGEIDRFMSIADKKMLKNNGFDIISDQDTYKTYIALLHKIKNELPAKYRILDIEMYLFSEVKGICQQALKKRWPCMAEYSFCQR